MFADEDPKNQLQPYLRPGERLLWSGKPDRAHYCRLRGTAVAVGVFWTVITAVFSGGFIFAAFFAEGGGFPPLVNMVTLLFFVPFWAIGLWLLGGHKFVYARSWPRVAYGITDQSILILQPGFFGSIKEIRLPLKESENVSIERFRGGQASVTFIGVISGRTEARHPRHPELESLADADRVLEIARAAANQNATANIE